MPFLFPDFKKKAVTFSYDDGTRQDFRLTERFRRFGLKATFNLVSGWLGDTGRIDHFGFDVCFDKVRENEVASLYHGFEIASHSVHHLDLRAREDSFVQNEILPDISRLELLCDNPVTGFAYPGGTYDKNLMRQLTDCGIQYARTIVATGDFTLPESFLEWHPSCHDSDSNALDLAKRLVQEDAPECRLLFIWGHSFEFDKTDFNRWSHMEQICETVSGYEDIWYASNGEICRYVTAARSVYRKGNSLYNPSNMDIYWEENGKYYLLTANR